MIFLCKLIDLLEGLAPVQIDEPNPEELLDMEISKKGPAEEEEEEEGENEVQKRLSPEHLHRLFLFSLTWSMGALLDSPSAIKFNKFVREKFTSFDWPNSRLYPDATVFDFVVNSDGWNFIKYSSILFLFFFFIEIIKNKFPLR